MGPAPSPRPAIRRHSTRMGLRRFRPAEQVHGVRQSAHAVLPRGSAGSPARRRHRRAHRRLPSRPGALRDGIRHRPCGQGRCCQTRDPRGVVAITPTSPRYAEAYGAGWLKRAVRRLHRADSTDPAGECIRRRASPAKTCCALDLRDVEVWGRGVDTEAFHPGRRVGGAACGAGDGEPLHLSLRGTSCVGEARRRRWWMPSGWRARWCPGA